MRTVWEGRMEGTKVAGRPITKLLDWLTKETDNRTHEDLKNLSLGRRRRRTWDLGRRNL